MIRNAQMKDVKAMYDLLHHFADKGVLLGRSLSSLYDQLRDFQVFVEEGDTGEEIVGICSLHICWENLAEVRSLAVKESAQGKGVGRQLVESCIQEAKALGIKQVFTLTYQPGFFRLRGFEPIDKKELPHKVWSDCINCPKFPDCNEEALVWNDSGYE